MASGRPFPLWHLHRRFERSSVHLCRPKSSSGPRPTRAVRGPAARRPSSVPSPSRKRDAHRFPDLPVRENCRKSQTFFRFTKSPKNDLVSSSVRDPPYFPLLCYLTYVLATITNRALFKTLTYVILLPGYFSKPPSPATMVEVWEAGMPLFIFKRPSSLLSATGEKQVLYLSLIKCIRERGAESSTYRYYRVFLQKKGAVPI